MKFTCPHCRRESDYEDILMDADLLAIMKMLPVFGKHHNLVWAYCELFGIAPLKTRRKKLRLLLEEVKRLFDTEEFVYQKKRYRITDAGIVEALNIVAKKHFPEHLENHNYLKRCMISIAEASAKTTGIEAEKDLRKKEDRLRYPVREEHVEPPRPASRHAGASPRGNTGRYPEETAPGENLTEEQRQANLRCVGDILKKMGGGR